MSQTRSLQLIAHGKCIVAGEHSVLRGFDSLVVPVTSRAISLKGRVGLRSAGAIVDLVIRAEGLLADELPSLFLTVLERAYLLSPGSQRIVGELQISNDLPFGSGLGASASLCVVVARLFETFHLLDRPLFEFARELENLFHGESSGVDIAVTLTGKPIIFNRLKGIQEVLFQYLPALSLHPTGKRGITRECIDRVKHLHLQNPDLGRTLDRQMQDSVNLCLRAFRDHDQLGLVEGLDLAQKTFQTWGLVDQQSQAICDQLINQGALSVKMTGSGLGGYVLALWTDPEQIKQHQYAISVFN